MNRPSRGYARLGLGALLAVSLAGGCGTKRPASDGGPADAHLEATADILDAGPPPDGLGAACEPALQDCPAGLKCDFFCDGTRARVGCRSEAPGAGAAGAVCGGSAVCGKGTGCLAAGPASAVCRPYCNSDAECSAGRCQTANITVACGGAQAPLMLKICF
jgi:hypothetical protein